MASWTGWIAFALLVCAGLVPALVRLRTGKRAKLEAPPVSWHVTVGLAAAGAGLLHPMTALFALGSPEAIGGGPVAIALGGVAFVLLLAHAGIGFKLRDPALKRRADARRRHLATAVSIAVVVSAHAAACWFGGR